MSELQKKIKKLIWWIKFVFVIIPAIIIYIFLSKIQNDLFNIALDMEKWVDKQIYNEQDFNK